MRYFSYHEYKENPTNDNIVTVSDEDIRRNYYPHWYNHMCYKFGKATVDATYSFEDCLENWKTIHWAWEVKD